MAAAVFVLAAVPYLNGLVNGFTFDDVPLVAKNTRIRSLGNVHELFATDWWNGQRPQSLLYRPLTMSTFAIDYAVARGTSAVPFHVQNVVWHGAASAALFLLILEMFGNSALALAAAALFSVHPVHTETVDGIVGRAELMSACFTFLALIAAWRAIRNDSRGALQQALAFSFTLLALLSKEQAIVIPAVPLLWLFVAVRDERLRLVRSARFRRLMVVLVLAPLVYLTLRGAVVGAPFPTAAVERGAIVVDNPIAGADGLARWLTPVRVFGHALGLVAFPWTLSADYSYDQFPLVTLPNAAAVGGLLALCALTACAFVQRHRAPEAAFGIGFALLTWVLTSNLPIVIGTIFGERLLYLPSAGACLVLAYLLTGVGRAPFVRRAGTVALTLIVVAGAARTWARNRDWLSSETLFKSAVAASPRSCKALDGYASELLATGRPKDAVPWAERALAIYPLYPSAHLTLAKSLRLLAKEDTDPGHKAELIAQSKDHAETVLTALRGAAGNDRIQADAWNVLGALALDEGDAEDAQAAFAKSLEKAPDFVPSLIGAGVAEAMRGDQPGAVSRFERAVELDPGSVEARQNLEVTRRGDAEAEANVHGVNGSRLLGQKRFAEALVEFREAARLQPSAARAYLGIGSVLTAQAEAQPDASGRSSLIDDAVRSFEHALELEPHDAVAHMNLGIVYLRLRPEPAKVVEHFEAYLRLVPDSPQRDQMERTIETMRTAPVSRPPVR